MIRNPYLSIIGFLSTTGLALTLACGGGGGTPISTPAPPPQVTVTISPSTLRILPLGSQTFSATVVGTTNQAVTWSITEGTTGGLVSASGGYSAPAGLGTFQLKATSTVNTQSFGSASILVSRFAKGSETLFSHFAAAVTPLSDGRILICGGYQSQKAEVFDPATGIFTAVADMSVARYGHRATLLSSGKVLVTGGLFLKSAEIFDPLSNTFSPLPDMAVDRYLHAALLLANGKVLLVGTDNYLDKPQATELFDPTTQQFSRTGDIRDSRHAPTAVMLSNGKVLVAGGFVDGPPLTTRDSAEVYDPATGQWNSIGKMTTARSLHTATLMQDGKVILAGGVDATDSSLNTAEIFDPALSTFTPTAPFLNKRDSHVATVLSDGSILFMGGKNTVTIVVGSSTSTSVTAQLTFERFDAVHGTFVPGDEPTPFSDDGHVMPRPDGLPWIFSRTSQYVYHP